MLLVSISKAPCSGTVTQSCTGNWTLRPGSFSAAPLIYITNTTYNPPYHFTAPTPKAWIATSTAWHDFNDCLWHLGIIKRLWCRRLISVWLKLAELPYRVSSWRKRKEAAGRLAKRPRYHMISVAGGYTTRPFFCAKSFSEGIWRLHLYTNGFLCSDESQV